MRNLIYITALDGIEETMPHGIVTWDHYCEKYNIDLIVSLHRSGVPEDVTGHWFPYYDPHILSEKWDRILFVDADVMVRWNAPNIFEHIDHKINKKFCVAKDQAGLFVAGIAHLGQWRNHFDVQTPPEMYFNSGMVCQTRECYTKIVDKIPPYFDFWRENYPLGRCNGFEQTPLNIISWNEIGRNNIGYLDYTWNDMVMFNHKDLSFINKSFIWHFTGPNMGGMANREVLMQEVWDKVSHNYE